jgi:hypothetical protein
MEEARGRNGLPDQSGDDEENASHSAASAPQRKFSFH